MTTAYETDGPHSSREDERAEKRDVAPLDRRLLDLEAATTRLRKGIAELAERLNPVLSPSVPVSEGVDRLREATQSRSVVVERIGAQVDEIDMMIESLVSLAARLEV